MTYGSIVSFQRDGISCIRTSCQKGHCRSCQRNRWIEEHTCEWCGVQTIYPRHMKGHVLCNSPDCEWLLFEALAKKEMVH